VARSAGLSVTVVVPEREDGDAGVGARHLPGRRSPDVLATRIGVIG
jgi:hypothetical protein